MIIKQTQTTKRPILSIPFGGKRIAFADQPPRKSRRDPVAIAAVLEVLG